MSSELPPYATTSATSSTSFAELSSIVAKYFKIIQAFIDVVHGGIPTFIVQPDKNSMTNFEKLKNRLEPRSLLPVLREGEEKGQCALRIFSERRNLVASTGRKRKIPIQLVLLVATMASVTAAGYFISQDWFATQTMSLSDMLVTMVLYAAGLMAILVVHEMGHMIASKVHMTKSSLPYFIPAPPILGAGLITPGTFGALITQTDLPANRNELSDLGISGPISGFLVAVIVTFIGISLSYPLPYVPPPGEGVYLPPIMVIIVSLFPGRFPDGYEISFHPLAIAGYFGIIVTALNLFPISQLDGGHLARAALGPTGYQRASAIALVFLWVLALVSELFLLFAVLALFFYFGGRHPGPLDDVSRITRGRKAMVILGFIVLFLSLPMEYLKILQYV